MTATVLWLDGCFGAGKTTTAARMVERRPGLLLLDPERIGALLWELDPALRAEDFRSLRLWRRLVVEHVIAVLEEYDQPVVVPMSLFDPTHVDELVGELRRRGAPLLHVRLVVDEPELRRRITAQRMSHDEARDARIRAFRLGQLPAGLLAVNGEPLVVGGRGPEEVAHALLALLEEPRA